MAQALAQQNETLDHLCYRTIGSGRGIVETVMEMNPGLADLGPQLPEGTRVALPDEQPRPQPRETIQLWT